MEKCEICGESKFRTKEEIEKAIYLVNQNKDLMYGYREDVTLILNWVLGGKCFDGVGCETN